MKPARWGTSQAAINSRMLPSPLDPPDYIEEFHVNDYAKWEDNNWEKLTEDPPQSQRDTSEGE